MALYSLVIDRGGKSYSTQLHAESASEAVAQYFNDFYPSSGESFFGDDSPKLNAKDILYLSPMEGLINMWTACAGRDGEYVSVICSRTVSRHYQSRCTLPIEAEIDPEGDSA